ncbi:MAG TPA: exo-alpha-sialidase [Polyangia bacterium]|nr:exo-alpha-sialidase [Polyangia bacterium]
MSNRLFVSTRKGLFSFVRGGAGRWEIERVSFLGDAVSLALHDGAGGGDGTLYAALGLGHFGVKMRRSSDLGARWDEVAAPAFPPQPEGHVETFADGKPWPWRVEQIWSLETGAHGSLWCGTIGGGLFQSSDRAASWTLSQSLWDHPKRKAWFGGGAELPGIHSLCVSPRDPRAIVLGVSCGGVWRSEDGGGTWALGGKGMFAEYMPPNLRDDPAIQDPHRVVACRANPDRLWCQHHNGVFRSDDGGRSWETIANVPPAVFGFAVAVDPNDGDTAWFIPAQKDQTRVPVDARIVVSRTRDGGRTWQVLTEGLPQDHAYDLTFRHGLDVDASGRRLAFGSTTGSLWLTEDAGDRWTCLSTHLPPIYAVRFAAS